MSRSKRTTVELTARPAPATGHGGNVARLAREKGIEPSAIIDFSANLNPLGPPDWLREVLSRAISELGHYPDPGCTSFLEALSRRFDVPPETLVAGNGTSEIIFALPLVLGKTRALIPSPAYIDYRRAAALHGVQVEEPILSEEHGFAICPETLDRMTTPDTVVFIGQPANPTGTLCDADALRWLAERHPRAAFVVDEAYIDLVQGGARYSLRTDRPKNVVVLYSLTKAFCIPGLRLGAVFASPERCRRLREHLPPWNVNALALAVGERALSDVEYIDKTVARVKALRQDMEDELKKIPGLTVYPGRANFLLLRSEVGDLDAGTIAERLLDSSLAIRVCDNYAGLDRRYFRLAGSPAEINLKPRDIVDMHMAKYADAPVLLVGDIDRGGIFASFVGTLELLTEAERERIAGFVINRFRGDARLLDTGIDYLARRTGRPVLGCIPYLRDLSKPVTGSGGARFEIDSALDRLADTISQHSDIERILKLVGIE